MTASTPQLLNIKMPRLVWPRHFRYLITLIRAAVYGFTARIFVLMVSKPRALVSPSAPANTSLVETSSTSCRTASRHSPSRRYPPIQAVQKSTSPLTPTGTCLWTTMSARYKRPPGLGTQNISLMFYLSNWWTKTGKVTSGLERPSPSGLECAGRQLARPPPVSIGLQ